MGATSRRDVLRLGLAGAGGAWLAARGAAQGAGAPEAGARDADGAAGARAAHDALDRALERLHARPSSDAHFLSNHVPMAAEALVALGRGDAVDAWIDARFEPAPREVVRVTAIEPDAWRAALGRPARFHDWRARFAAELAGADWRDVVRRWAPRLVPGLAGSATHGVIRTAHAVRAIEARDNAIRRTELGVALAYWAAFATELPWDGTRAPAPSAEAALAQVAPRREKAPPPRGNIVTGLRALDGYAPFAPVAGLLDAADPARTLGEVTALFARVFLANPAHRIHFTHAITAPSAARLLLPFLDDRGREEAVRRAWQAAAGLYAVYHDPDRDVGRDLTTDRAHPPRDRIVANAVANGAPHAVKLVEACLREHALAPDDARLQAAWDGANAIGG